MAERLRIATWNMHRAVGMDGRFLPHRIAQVIAEPEVGKRSAPG